MMDESSNGPDIDGWVADDEGEKTGRAISGEIRVDPSERHTPDSDPSVSGSYSRVQGWMAYLLLGILMAVFALYIL